MSLSWNLVASPTRHAEYWISIFYSLQQKSYLIIERCCHEIYNFRVKIQNFVSKFPWIILKIGEIRKWKLNWALMYNRENFEKLKFQGFSSYTTDVIQPLILLFILYLKCILIYVAIATKMVKLVLTDISQFLITTPTPLLSYSRSLTTSDNKGHIIKFR